MQVNAYDAYGIPNIDKKALCIGYLDRNIFPKESDTL